MFTWVASGSVKAARRDKGGSDENAAGTSNLADHLPITPNAGSSGVRFSVCEGRGTSMKRAATFKTSYGLRTKRRPPTNFMTVCSLSIPTASIPDHSGAARMPPRPPSRRRRGGPGVLRRTYAQGITTMKSVSFPVSRLRP